MQSLHHPHDRLSLLLLPFHALAFWARNQLAFWIAALPVAVLAATLTWFEGADERWVRLPLFAVIYALFLDRWHRIVLLADAPISEEADALRHSLTSVRFLLFALGVFALAVALQLLPIIDVLVWSLVVAPLLLYLPALSAGEPIGLGAAWRLARPVQITLFITVCATAILAMLAQDAADLGTLMLPRKPWLAPAMAGAARLADCLLLAVLGYVTASLYRALSGWQPPEPADRPYRVRRRNS